jgi:glycosyltransferase involved in cell wall biosynthesis
VSLIDQVFSPMGSLSSGAATSPADLPTRCEQSATVKKKKIGILIVAYNAVTTLRQVLDRIPPDLREKIDEVFVFDDCSKDDTYMLGVGYKEMTGWKKLKLFRNPENLGYGGNQKKGYRYAIDNGFDIVVLLHGDGQYAPECMGRLLEPLERGEAEAVFGSRMMERGASLKGGMPLYKFVGNKILTAYENAMLGMDLSEFHSGYRAYDVHALAEIPFEKNTNDFHFDTEIIIQLHQRGMRIAETPIPTYYGDEICHVNGMKYAGNVFKAVMQYRLQKAGVKSYPQFDENKKYPIKRDKYSSHDLISRQIKGRAPRVLDVGCGSGHVSAFLRNESFYYVGVDYRKPDDLQPQVSLFHERDIERDFNLPYGGEFDYVVFGDVLEHLRNPEEILLKSREYLKPDGRIIVSVPNIQHWSTRLLIATGNFTYMDRGILDRTHLKFFTKKSIARLLKDCGFETIESLAAPVPLSPFVGNLAESTPFKMLAAVQYGAANFWKNLFAYQLISVARLNGAQDARAEPGEVPSDDRTRRAGETGPAVETEPEREPEKVAAG